MQVIKQRIKELRDRARTLVGVRAATMKSTGRECAVKVKAVGFFERTEVAVKYTPIENRKCDVTKLAHDQGRVIDAI
jgi:hypothetical protein